MICIIVIDVLATSEKNQNYIPIMSS